MCLRQVVALQIMRANYEQLVKAHQRAPQVQEDLVPDEVKFQVNILRLYMSFSPFIKGFNLSYHLRCSKSSWIPCSNRSISK